MGYRDDSSLGDAEKVLLTMHNLSLVRPEIAWTDREIARSVYISEDILLRILKDLEIAGYVKSFSDNKGIRRFYLTSRGIIKISTLFT
jgi:hypothetical protein